MSITDDIKDYALDLGYSKVGITRADGFPDYAAELKLRYEMYGWYIERHRLSLPDLNPRDIMPSAKSLICLVYDYARESFPENLVGKVGRFYQARCSHVPESRINGARSKLMRQFLENNGCQIGKGIFIPERLAAARAGIITYGKNCFAYAENIGSFIHLSSFVTDVELEYDEPTLKVRCPAKCTICVDACPTKAIYEPLKMNPRRCIAFNTFFSQDGIPGTTSLIPPDIRDNMGTWIHGCDICQQVCPRNQRRLKTKLPQNEFLEKIAKDFDLPKLLDMDEEFYRRRVQPLMYNYIRDKRYFQRNAAIAIGNTGDPVFIPVLAKAMKNPEDLVRGYAAWAIGKIGGPQSKQILESHLTRETKESVKKEILSALAALLC